MIAASENKFDSLFKKMLLKRWLASSNVAPRSLFNASWYEFNPTGSPGCLRIIIILLKMASYDTDTSSF